LTSLSDANGLIIVPEDITEATVNDEVTVAFLPAG
jgi:molybdopterin molybdotransferase